MVVVITYGDGILPTIVDIWGYDRQFVYFVYTLERGLNQTSFSDCPLLLYSTIHKSSINTRDTLVCSICKFSLTLGAPHLDKICGKSGCEELVWGSGW